MQNAQFLHTNCNSQMLNELCLPIFLTKTTKLVNHAELSLSLSLALKYYTKLMAKLVPRSHQSRRILDPKLLLLMLSH